MKALKQSEKGVSWDTGKQRRGFGGLLGKQVGNALGGVVLAGSASSQMGVSHESNRLIQ